MQGGKAVEVSKMGHPSLDEVTNILTVERWCWKQFIDEEPSASLECWALQVCAFTAVCPEETIGFDWNILAQD